MAAYHFLEVSGLNERKFLEFFYFLQQYMHIGTLAILTQLTKFLAILHTIYF